MGCHEIWVQSPRIGTVILNSLLIPAALGKSRATLGLGWRHYWGYLPEHGWLKNSCVTGNPTPSWAMAQKSRPGAPCTACRQLHRRAFPKPLLVSPLPCRMLVGQPLGLISLCGHPLRVGLFFLLRTWHIQTPLEVMTSISSTPCQLSCCPASRVLAS